MQSFKVGDRVLPAGSELFGPGDVLTELYNLLDGWVVLYRVLPSGNRQIVDFALPGAFLGHQPDLDAPSELGAECLTDVVVCAFPRKSFQGLVMRHPAMSLQLSAILAKSLMRAHAKLTNIGSRSAVERTAHLLYDIASQLRGEKALSSPEVFELPITQTHLAEALGLSSVYINKTLRELRESGVLMLRGHRLTVIDPVRFRELAGHEFERAEQGERR